MRGKASILIVEDEAIVAADLAAKLRQLGYHIAGTTATGEEAVTLARERGPSLVLMDIRLAGAMDGPESAAAIRRECDVPVVFLTAHADRDTIERAGQAEAYGYVLKPFDERELETQIEMTLFKHAADRRLRLAHDELEQRVAERTAELARAKAALEADMLVRERLQAEILAAGELERQRISQDMHDGLAQLLTGLRIKSELLVQHLDGATPRLRASAADIARLLGEALDQSRNIVHGLQPVEPLPEGLASAVRQLAASTSRLFDIKCRCTVSGRCLVADHHVAIHLYRIAQEAITNAVKHGHARAITIALAGRGRRMTLTVSNDGRPFQPVALEGGIGIRSMNYRAERIGGKIDIQPRRGGGAVVRCSLPLSGAPGKFLLTK
jgi:signal transduction histidine kinase